MFDRSLKIERVAGIGVAVAAFWIAAPVATADPAPLVIPHRQTPTRPGEGLSGSDRSWLSLEQRAPRLGEGLTGADRSWLAATTTDRQLPSNRFDWGDAGIGAGAAAAVLLFLSGSAVAIRRRHSTAH